MSESTRSGAQGDMPLREQIECAIACAKQEMVRGGWVNELLARCKSKGVVDGIAEMVVPPSEDLSEYDVVPQAVVVSVAVVTALCALDLCTYAGVTKYNNVDEMRDVVAEVLTRLSSIYQADPGVVSSIIQQRVVGRMQRWS